MNRAKTLETILVLVLALGIFYWIFRESSPVVAKYLLLSAAILGAIGLFIPSLAEKIHWAWMKLAHVMGFVMSRVLLTLIYCVVLLPLAFMSRALGKKNGVRLKGGLASYFTDRNFTYNKESMENVW